MKGILTFIQAAFQTRARRPGHTLGASGRGAAGAVGPMVRLLGDQGRSPATPFEQLVVAALQRRGALPLRALAVHVAKDLYLDELRNGTWAADIGLFGASLFVPEVAREVEAGNGGPWRIEGPAAAGGRDPSPGRPPRLRREERGGPKPRLPGQG